MKDKQLHDSIDPKAGAGQLRRILIKERLDRVKELEETRLLVERLGRENEKLRSLVEYRESQLATAGVFVNDDW